MGVDMWAAELLLRMKEQQAYQDVELCLALPFEGYNADWDDWHRKRMDFICRYAEKVLVLGEMPSSESYKKRNYYMFQGLVRKYNKHHKPDEALPNITPHTMRHTFCTRLAQAGMNPKDLQYIMGHSNITMTLNYYAHADYASAKAAMDKLAA